MKVHFTIPGPPVGKGRPRFRRTGNYVSTYTPAKTAQYESRVREEYQRQCGNAKFDAGVPLDMRVTAYFQIPKSVSKGKHRAMAEGKILPVIKSDVDNIFKALADSGNGLIYHDDSQIVFASIRKYYSEVPRVVVTIQEAEH